MSAGKLILISWHIGDARDMSDRSIEALRALGVLLVEDIEYSREGLRRLGVNPNAKTVLAVPERPNAEFLARVLATLARGDVGMLSSGGTPGFVDPGAWLVAEVRRRGGRVEALPGPSCLATMLAMSGIEWRDKRTSSFTFAFFLDGPPGGGEEENFTALARRPEPLLVFLLPGRVERCLALLEPVVGRRPVTIFFDLSKPRNEYPMADEARTMTCAQWREVLPSLPWKKISDLALMVGP